MIFFKVKEICFLIETIDMKRLADKLNMHTFLLLNLFILSCYII